MVIVLTVVALLYGNILSHIKNLNIFQLSNNYIFVFVATLIIMGISMFIHEISHGVVAYKYGLIPKQLVVSLYLYISPIVYLKIPGIYTVNPKTRVKIWSAGIMTYIIGTQVFNAYNIFTTNLKMSNSFMQSLWAIKFYIIIILLFVVSKIKRFITYNNETHSLIEWADILHIDRTTLSWRIKHWGIEKAFAISSTH